MAQPSAPPTYEDAVKVNDGTNLVQQEFPPVAAQYNPPVAPYPVVASTAGYPPTQSDCQYPSEQQYMKPYRGGGFTNPNFEGNPGVAGYLPASSVPVALIEPAASLPAQPHNESGGFTMRGTFDDQSVRRLFIRKVFITLGLQLLFTFGIVCVFTLVDSVGVFVRNNPAVYYSAYAVFLVMYLVLVCSTTASRKHPCNLIMLILLTVALTYMTATISSFYTIQAVMIGLAVTVGVCFTVILFSMQTKFDFTKCGGLLFILLMVLFLFSFITIFTYWRTWYLQVVYGALGALVFTLFLAYDTQLVMGGKKYELDPEEYIFGALVLYIDVIYIFLFLLAIFGGSSK